MTPEPLKLLKVPPMTVTSLKAKSVLASLRVKLMAAVCVPLSVVLSEPTTTVGGVVSTGVLLIVNDTALFVSAPSLFRLPAASLNLSELTTTAALVAPAEGVKVAV